jgi:hypothetical protein
MRYGLSGPDWPERPFSDFEQHRVGAENILPLAEIALIRLPNDPIIPIDYAGGSGYEVARDTYARLLDMHHREGGAYIAILQPETEGGDLGGSSNTPNRLNRWLNFQSNPSSPGTTLAHEIGHWFGRPHTWDDPEFPRRTTPGFTGDPWADPAPDIGDLVGIRTYPTLQLVTGRNLDGSANVWDLMAYKMPRWISAFTYCKLLAAISDGRSRCSDRIEGGG